MWKYKKLLFFLFVPLCFIAGALWYFHEAQVVRLDYEGFTVWLDCTKRGAVQFRYVPVQDRGGRLQFLCM